MRIVVTGGAGFIGSHLVEYWQHLADVVVLDDLSSGNLANLANLKCTLIKASITDREAVFAALKGADYLFHLAALVSVPESVERVSDCNEINIKGLVNVLDAARAHGLKKVIFSSSSAVYGDAPVLPKAENMLLAPMSPYAITKLTGEYYLQMYHNMYGLAAVSLRYFNVFGPRQSLKSAYAAAVPIFVEKALKNEPISIFGSGQQTRDFVYVKDVVAANVLAATNEQMSGVYNVASGSSISIEDLAKTIIKLTASASNLEYLPARIGDVLHSAAATSKLAAYGFKCQYSLTRGLQEFIEAKRQEIR